ncbi:hypothetical protein GCM10009128_11360 [Psychrosphaera haliotis]
MVFVTLTISLFDNCCKASAFADFKLGPLPVVIKVVAVSFGAVKDHLGVVDEQATSMSKLTTIHIVLLMKHLFN